MANSEKFQAIIEVNSQQAKKNVEELRRQQEQAMNEVIKLKAKDSGATKEQIKAAESKLKAVSQALKTEEKHVKGLGVAMDKLSKKNYKELQSEVRTLNRMMRDGTVTKNSKEWHALAERIKAAKREMKEYNDVTREHKSVWSNVFSFLQNSWGGMLVIFQSITGLSQTVRKSVADFAQMEEAMANTRKYTGMTDEQVRDLNEAFKQMDTRTSREELNELAGAAGRLGKTSRQDILDFVEAGNMIKVALGDDLGEGAIDKVGKLAMAFGEDEKMGLRGAMLATGSAVNELAQNSSAQAGYLVDFTARVAGFGKQLGLTQAQIMGFGAVMDENLLRDEMAATAFGNMLTKMQTDTAKFAKIAGMDLQSFTKLMKEDANGAVLALADSLKRADGQTMMKMLDDMGLDGSRAVGVLSTLADKIDDVRARQDLATKAYDEATSIENEYNVMNHTTQAELEKAKKAFHELAVELGQRLKPAVTYTITAGGFLVRSLNTIIGFVTKYRKLLLVLAAGIITYTIAVNKAIITEKLHAAAMTIRNGLHKIEAALVAAKTAAMTAWGIVVDLVTGKISLATAAQQLWNTVIAANPIGAAVTAVTALVAAIALLSDTENEEAKAEKAVNEVRDEAKKKIQDEVTEINLLIEAANDERLTIQEREKAIDKLNKKIPEYNGKLDTTRGKYTANKQALDKYIDSLIKMYEVMGAKEKLQELGRKKVDLQLQRAEAEDRVREKQQNLNAANFSNNSSALGTSGARMLSEGMNVGVNQAKSELSEARGELENVNKQIRVLDTTEKKLIATFGEALHKNAVLEQPDLDPHKNDDGGGGDSSYTSDDDKKGKKTGKKTSGTTNKEETERNKKMRKELQEQKAQNDAELALNMQKYNKGEIDYRQYIQRQHEISLNGYDERMAIYKKYNENYKQLEDDKAKEEMALQNDLTKFSLSDLEKKHQMEKILIEESYYDRNSEAYQNERAVDEALYQAEIEYLQKKADLQRKGSEERAATENEITLKEEQHKLEQAERYEQMLEEYREQWLAMGNEKQMKIALDGLEELHAKQLLSEEEYQKMKLAIQAQYAQNPQTQGNEQFDANVSNAKAKAQAAAGDGYDKTQPASLTNNPIVGRIVQYRDMMEEIKRMEQEGVLSHAEAEQAKRETTAEMLQDMVSQTQAAFDSINQVMQAASSYYSAQSQLEQNETAKKYDKEIEKAGNNQAKRKKLEEKKEKELAKIKNKYNKKTMKIELAQAIAQTAMSAINAYSSAAAIPLIGFTIAPNAAAMAVAAGMMQIAAIKKQHAAEQSGYYEGGFTGGKRYRKEAGVVHEGEFVVNHDGVNNSSLMPVLRLFDEAQRNNTIGSLTARDVTRSLGQGNAVITPIVNIQQDNEDLRQSLDGMNESIDRLNTLLEDPQPAIVSMEQLDKEYKTWNRMQKNK